MRYLMAVLICMMMTMMAVAQEEPEPTEPPVSFDLAQDFQIQWNNGTWESLIPDTMTVAVEAVPTTHTYWSGLGLQTWKFLEESTDTADPTRIVTITFDIDSLVSGWWGFYRVRARKRSTTTGQIGVWGEASYWKGIITLGQPGRPIY